MCAVAILLLASPVDAHPAPFSYLDLHLDAERRHRHARRARSRCRARSRRRQGRLAARSRQRRPAIATRWWRCWRRGSRCDSTAGRSTITWGAIDVVPDRQSLRLAFTVKQSRPGHIAHPRLRVPVRSDPPDLHQHLRGLALKLQAILDASHQDAEYYSGSTQGRWAVVQTFVLSGIEHILIGPDHILFLIGLLLLGGTLSRLALIVTAFTIGHSITLSLAALDILSPPARFIEPLIALTIVVVGADNLLVLARPTRRRSCKSARRDIRGVAGGGLRPDSRLRLRLRAEGIRLAAGGARLVAVRVQPRRRDRPAADRRGGRRHA